MSISNPSLAAFLLDNGPRCIKVSYDRAANRKGDYEPVDVKSFKTFDTSIKKDDFVVIPTDTRWGFSVGRVEEVDTRINYSSSEQMRWIAGKVDTKSYNDVLAQEEKLIGTVARAQETKAKRELAEELKQMDPELTALLSAPAPFRNGGPESTKRGGAQSGEPDGFAQ